MYLDGALNLARRGMFVTNNYFDEKQSLHFFDGKFYYEDGAVVTEEFLEQQEFAMGDSWSIKYSNLFIDYKKLKKMHEQSRGLMLQDKSYEDVICGLESKFSTSLKEPKNSKEDIIDIIEAAKRNMRLQYKIKQ